MFDNEILRASSPDSSMSETSATPTSHESSYSDTSAILTRPNLQGPVLGGHHWELSPNNLKAVQRRLDNAMLCATGSNCNNNDRSKTPNSLGSSYSEGSAIPIRSQSPRPVLGGHHWALALFLFVIAYLALFDPYPLTSSLSFRPYSANFPPLPTYVFGTTKNKTYDVEFERTREMYAKWENSTAEEYTPHLADDGIFVAEGHFRRLMTVFRTFWGAETTNATVIEHRESFSRIKWAFFDAGEVSRDADAALLGGVLQGLSALRDARNSYALLETSTIWQWRIDGLPGRLQTKLVKALRSVEVAHKKSRSVIAALRKVHEPLQTFMASESDVRIKNALTEQEEIHAAYNRSIVAWSEKGWNAYTTKENWMPVRVAVKVLFKTDPKPDPDDRAIRNAHNTLADLDYSSPITRLAFDHVHFVLYFLQKVSREVRGLRRKLGDDITCNQGSPLERIECCENLWRQMVWILSQWEANWFERYFEILKINDSETVEAELARFWVEFGKEAGMNLSKMIPKAKRPGTGSKKGWRGIRG